MADISKITLPSGTTYDIKDAVARQTLSGAIKILGATTTALTDEATTNPITVNGESVTAVGNDAVFYNSKEFVFDGTYWHEFGDMTGLGDLAEYDYITVSTATTSDVTATVSAADSGDATYTPSGSISGATCGVATTESWDNLSAVIGTGTGNTETLVLSTTSKEAAKTVEMTSQGSFTGTGARLVTGNITVPATFSATAGNN